MTLAAIPQAGSTIIEAQPEQAQTNKVFVYGTLMPGHYNYRVVQPFVVRNLGAAYIQHAAMFNLGFYPGVIINLEHFGERDFVHGVLLELNPETTADALARMDRLEGYNQFNPESSHYIRRIVTVHQTHGDMLVPGTITFAYIYVYNRLVRDERRIQSGTWTGRDR